MMKKNILNSKGEISTLLLMCFLMLCLILVFSLKKIIIYSEHRYFETQTICINNFIKNKENLVRQFDYFNKAMQLLNAGELLTSLPIPIPENVMNPKMAKVYLIKLRQSMFAKYLLSLNSMNKNKCKLPQAFSLSPYQHFNGKLKLDQSSQTIKESEIKFTITGFNQEFKYYSNNKGNNSNEVSYKQL